MLEIDVDIGRLAPPEARPAPGRRPATLLVLDEAWIVLDHPLFAARIREWLKTLQADANAMSGIVA